MKYERNTCALQGTRWPGKGNVIKKELHDFIYWT
jgi:hypothetical protein